MTLSRARSRTAVLFGLLVSLGVSGCRSKPAPPPPRPPDVLLIVVDALRADSVGVNGYPLPTTPNIDLLAGEGVAFTNAFSHATWTKPSVATLLTSNYPAEHGIRRVAEKTAQGLRADRLRRRFTTIAECFSSAGYETAAVVNQVHLKAKYGFDQGFETFTALEGRHAFQLNEQVSRRLGEVRRGKPFFFYVHYLDAHWPYTARFAGMPPIFGPTALAHRPPNDASLAPQWAAAFFSPADAPSLKARYDLEVAFADAAIGELASILRSAGRYDNTIVAVTADHGEGFGEHGQLQHGYTPYDEVMRVPLVFRLPEPLRPRPGVRRSPAGLIDVMPTLLDLAGLPPEPKCQGASLRPAIQGDPADDRLYFTESEDAAAVRSAGYKLIRCPSGDLELYDLAADPREQTALDPRSRPEGARLLQALEKYLARAAKVEAGKSGAGVTVSASEMEQLRALGYLQ